MRAQSRERPQALGTTLRIAALSVLTLQNGTQALLVRYSKEGRAAGAVPYLGSTVVFVCECVKLVAAFGLLSHAHSPSRLLRRDAWKVSLLFALPAAVYALQNNLLLVAARALDPPTFLVLSQFKILTTAAFSVALMGRRLHRVRWCALLLLIEGVALVQHSHTLPAPAGAAAGAGSSVSRDFTVGVVAALAMSTLSGFAAVYTECALKRLRLPTQECNIYMAGYGALFSAMGCLLGDGERILQLGFWQGWDWVTVSVVAISAAGGLLVAFFLRYLDAILKNFAATAAIVLSTAASVPLFGFQPSLEWVLGAGVVVCAIVLYNETDVVDPPPLEAPPLRLLALLADAGNEAGALGEEKRSPGSAGRAAPSPRGLLGGGGMMPHSHGREHIV